MNKISGILKQAITTFSCSNEVLQVNVQKLKSLLDATGCEDVNLSPSFSSNAFWNTPNKAPVTYIHIFENELLTMGIFVLKPGMKLPLHDHPEMHGLIKVILGKVCVTSYSLNTEKTREVDLRSFQGNPNDSDSVFPRSIETAECIGKEILDINSETSILGPEIKNIHEIESVDGPAAFVDVLAPPYGTRSNKGERECNYFAQLAQIGPNLVKLQRISSPSWYWTDTFPYTGPDLTDSIPNELNGIRTSMCKCL